MKNTGSTITKGTLYMVATPIGNLADMTFRAVETLHNVERILCEDTRVTGKLLAHYDIATPTTAVHQHTNSEKIARIVAEIASGTQMACVTDAGTPGVSDPGNQLVAAAVAAGVRIVPLPGATAIGALISVAGIDLQRFTFLAYPPHKKGRQTFFSRVADSDIPVLYYESVHRVIKNLELLSEIAPEIQIILGRELTKMFEEVVRGSAEEVITYFSDNPDKVKGEFVVIAYGA